MKKSINIFKAIIPILIIAFAISGCKKMLDQKPLGRLSQDDLAGGGFEGQIFGLYSALRGQFNDDAGAWAFVLANDTRSDDASAGSNNGDNAGAAPMYDNFQYAKDNWLLANGWTKHYEIIGKANNIIVAIDSANLSDPVSLQQRAEAKFFRAWSYFALVKEFGEVPKIDFRIYSDADADKPKASVDDIFALIDADLADAAANLPLNWDAAHIGRVTKGTAEALQARSYLFRSNWVAALAASQSVIASNQYSLFPDFFGQFTRSNENNAESVFEVQAVYTQQSDADNGYSVGYAEVQGVRGQGDWDLGWGENVPTPVLADAFEPGDPRRDATLIYIDSVNKPYGEVITRANLVGDLSPTVFYFKKKGVYTDPADRATFGNKHGLWMNVRLMRYAEVLLSAAEAANELGGAANDTLAVNYLEMVRARARNGDNSVLPKINYVSQDSMRSAIRHERRIELATEGERFWDLVRWGTAQATFNALGIPYADKNKYFPIPQGEIDKSNGLTGALKQNPNY
ncbi:MAG: RagB/SusD family nutrient uptake outer membrane protein [Bacteroidota bacterium]